MTIDPRTGQPIPYMPLSTGNTWGARQPGMVYAEGGMGGGDTGLMAGISPGGGASPVWGSPQWNPTNDPQHATDLAWMQNGGLAALTARNNMGESQSSGVPLDASGMLNTSQVGSNWDNFYRPGLEFYGAAIGGAAAGSALGAGAEAGDAGAAGAAGETSGLGGDAGLYGSGVDEFGNPIGGGNFAGGAGTPGAGSFYTPGSGGFDQFGNPVDVPGGNTRLPGLPGSGGGGQQPGGLSFLFGGGGPPLWSTIPPPFAPGDSATYEHISTA